MIDYQNLFTLSKEHGLTPEEFNSLDQHLPEYLQNIKKKDQGFYTTIDDQENIDKIAKFAKSQQNKYQDIVVLGIGGSALGTICLKNSLTHLFKKQKPHLHIIDNIDPALITELEQEIDYTKTLFIVVTKSGTTPEVLSQYYYFKQKTNNFIFVTDPQKGILREISKTEKIPTFEIPPNVGGRFSVLTPVGLLPAALINLDINQLIAGSKSIRDLFLSTNPQENIPFQLAKIQYLLHKKGKTINVMMPYSQKLKTIADWYKQLLAESIGKKLNNQNQEIFTGITPTSALGVTDQHSQSQLYMEGPNDKLIIFIEVKNLGPELTTQNPHLNNVTFNTLLKTEKKGTEQALTKNNRPNITINIDSVCENTLGQLFMLFQGSTAFLGEMFNINAFNQPGVELSKILTKKLLS